MNFKDKKSLAYRLSADPQDEGGRVAKEPCAKGLSVKEKKGKLLLFPQKGKDAAGWLKNLGLSEKLTLILGVLGVIVILGAILLGKISNSANIEIAAVDMAKTYAKQVFSLRTFYANEIAKKAKDSGMIVDYDYHFYDNGIPAPDTLIYVFDEQISKDLLGAKIHLYSRYPLTHRENEPEHDEFQMEALSQVEKNPNEPVYSLAKVDGRLSIRYIVADVMNSSCVDCHNLHQKETKYDWKPGDVRGALEVVLPVDGLADSMTWGMWKTIAGITAGISGIVVILFLLIRNSVVKPIERIHSAAEEVGRGDLRVEINEGGHRELGEFAKNMNKMTRSLKTIIGNNIDATKKVMATIEGLREKADRKTEGAKIQSQNASLIAVAAEEMNQTIADIASNITLSSETSREAMETATKGKEVIDDAVKAANRVSASTGELASVVTRLDKSVKEIGDIVVVIKEIADQTNLLALNAAIEAARAGDQGRGFTVVADEVKKLAQKTISATAEISYKIVNIQAESEKTVASMKDASGNIGRVTGRINQLEMALSAIFSSIQSVNGQIEHISTAIHQQSSASSEVARNAESASTVAKETERLAEEVRREIQALTEVADELERSTAGFKLQ